MKHLLVIGGASFDILHLEKETVSCAGGAGMYTAMAAQRCGLRVSMFSNRPHPVPLQLQPIADRLYDWLGPIVPPEQLPHIEIAYGPHKTDYLKLDLGAQVDLTPALLPDDLSIYDCLHVIPLDKSLQQLTFVRACRQRGARLISAGTCFPILDINPQAVHEVINEVDIFFMNDIEASALFGSVEAACTAPGKLLFVTLGAEGARVIQGDTATTIPAAPAQEKDPTGAGDTFCGATLAYLLNNNHPIMAAGHAASLAAEMIAAVGPAALLRPEPPPLLKPDKRAVVNEQQVGKLAGQIAALDQISPYSAVGPMLPPVNHIQALDYFFAATLHQFSFWTTKNNHYGQPLIAKINGFTYKGSDYLWQAFWRQLEQDPSFCSPERQATLTRQEMLDLFRADNGDNPMPALDLHLQQANSYGRDMLALNLTPQSIINRALATAEPLQTFLQQLDHIGGYKEDPLRKKSALLALLLNCRPERFLPMRDDETISPIIDYHIMRASLRIGLVDVLDEPLRKKLAGRDVVSPAEEWAIRYPTYQAKAKIVEQSGRGLPAVNGLLFNARRYCPEMSEPQCDHCPVDAVCAHRSELFQPVIRTTFY